MKHLSTLTAEEVRRLFDYDPTTGDFIRKSKPYRTAGARNAFGHIQIRVHGVLFMAHRLAWLYVYGKWPSACIDHINGVPYDNRIINLRSATHKQNQENVKRRSRKNRSGWRGVIWSSRSQKWIVRIQHYGVRYEIGMFRDLDAAVTCAKIARDTFYTHNKTEYAA